MKTTLITLLAMLTLTALLVPVKLANSEIYKDLSGISISYKIDAHQDIANNKDADEPFLDESNESTLDSLDDNLKMEDWMTDLSAWETSKY